MNKEDLKRKAIELYNADNSYGEIATQLGIGKTTVYNWINSVPEQEIDKNVPEPITTVPNAFPNEMNDLIEHKEELQNEFGSDKDINALVELKKAEYEHEQEMERLDMERREQLHQQKMEVESKKSEQLGIQLDEVISKMEHERQKSEQQSSTIKSLEQNNSLLSLQLDDIKSQNQITKFDEELATDFSQQVNNYLDLEGNEITLEEVKNALEEVEETIEQFKQWVKNANGKKSDYPELSTLKKIRNSLSGMINQFEDLEEDELVFDFDSDFERDLKEQMP